MHIYFFKKQIFVVCSRHFPSLYPSARSFPKRLYSQTSFVLGTEETMFRDTFPILLLSQNSSVTSYKNLITFLGSLQPKSSIKKKLQNSIMGNNNAIRATSKNLCSNNFGRRYTERIDSELNEKSFHCRFPSV